MAQRDEGRPDKTEALKPHPSSEPLEAVVRVVAGTGAPHRLRIGAGTYRVGASADNHLIIDDPAVSREHLEVTLAAEGVHVRDLGSRNGTFYLGSRVGEMTLSLGSRLTLGATELSFESDVEAFEGTQGASPTQYGDLYGESPSMRRLFLLMKRLEGSLVNVLIEGESGTGKELIARALHDHSRVSAGPFVAINCGALDRSLVRSELFGHKKGAFTGATGENAGAFAEADGGTLFLDEIGELPLDIQPVLLRVLESGRYSRVGESKQRPTQVRIIAATNRNLKEEVEDGTFRSDLFYRLVVVKLGVAPLRQRTSDIPLLARRIAADLGMPPLPEEVVQTLGQRTFPGNVRELKHALQAYSVLGELSDGEAAPSTELDQVLRDCLDVTRPYAEQKEALVERMTRIYLGILIERCGGNRSEAARIAGLQRGYLRRLLTKYGLD